MTVSPYFARSSEIPSGEPIEETRVASAAPENERWGSAPEEGLALTRRNSAIYDILARGAFFTFAYAYFDPTIPLPEGDRLVGLENWDVSFNYPNRHSIHDYCVWREEMESVEDMSASWMSTRA